MNHLINKFKDDAPQKVDNFLRDIETIMPNEIEKCFILATVKKILAQINKDSKCKSFKVSIFQKSLLLMIIKDITRQDKTNTIEYINITIVSFPELTAIPHNSTNRGENI